MPRKVVLVGGPVLALVMGLLVGRLFLSPAGGRPASAPPSREAAPDAPATKARVWTCSMHPQIRQPGPGKCPICGMDLIPLVESHTEGDAGPRTMVMSASAVALAEIQTSRAERRFPEVTVRLVGQLDYDETRLRSLTARFPARIDELFVNYTGGAVGKGEHLARIYSPELLTAQRELLSAHSADADGSLTKVARDKLLLWDLLPEQIDAILARGSVSEEFELRSPMGGVVITKNVKEGDYVKTGDPLFRIADLGELWLHLQAFESDIAKLRYGQEVSFTVEAWPGETFRGRIAFIAPQVDPMTRTVPVRVDVPNADARLKPGMFAKGEVRVRLAAGNQVFAPDLAGKWISPMHPEIIKDHPGFCDVCGMPLVSAESLGYSTPSPTQEPLVVPASAVLRTGKRAVVYVKETGMERNAFEGRVVELGADTDGGVIVTSGLVEGEEVVTHGAFAIDSSLQIMAKPSMMSPEGADRAAAHDHGAMPGMTSRANPMATSVQPAASAAQAAEPELVIEPAMARALLPAYFKLQAALAGDDLGSAREALRAAMQGTGHEGPLPDLIHLMMGAEKLDGMRDPAFARLSAALIKALKREPAALEGTIVHMHCPMVGESGADWLQPTETLRNPYFGADMLTCGTVVEHLK